MDLITYGLLNKAKANLDSPAFTGTPTAPTPLTPDNSNKLATTEFVRFVIATLKGFYLGVTTTTLVDEVTTDPNVVINGETVTAEDGNWVIAEGGEEFVYSGTVWQKFGDSNWISVIGNTYNPALTYNTGDCVIYMDGLYECKEDNVTGDWDSTKWQSTTVIDLITGGIPLENLSNVDIVNPQAGNHLVFDGTKWKNSTIVSPALSELSDVELENATDGQALVYNDTTDKWENQDIPTGQVTKTATGNPIELTDAANAPLVKCVTQIQGSQDLHGQDKPWVGGAGKNKFPMTVDGLKAANTSGTWSGNTYTLYGVTFTILTDSAENVIGIKVHGLANERVDFIPTNGYFTLPANSYILNGCSNGSSSTYRLNLYKTVSGGNELITQSLDGDSPSFTLSGDENLHSHMYISQGVQVDTVIYPMIRLSTVTDSTFAPYSNICPITAYTEGEIKVRGLNCIPDGTDTTKGYESGYILKKDGTTQSNFNYCISEYFKIEPNADYTYCIYPTVTGGIIGFCYYNTNKEYIIGDNIGNGTTTLTAPSNAVYARATIPSDLNTTYKILVFKGRQRPSEWVAYINNQSTTTFPSAIYQGSEDVVGGTVEKTWNIIDLGDRTWSKSGVRFYTTWLATDANKPYANATEAGDYLTNAVCTQYHANTRNAIEGDNYAFSIHDTGAVYLTVVDSRYSTVEDFKAAMSGVMVAYPFATPTTTPVTPTNLPIRTLSGYNHIESSTGEMEVEYITQSYQPLVDLIQSSKHMYSTQEQIVGTWIDGSTVYEKTIAISGVVSGVYQISMSGIKDLISYSGYVNDNWTPASMLPIPRVASDGNNIGIGNVYTDYFTLIIPSAFGSRLYDPIITIRYTKTTQTRSLSAPLTSQTAQIEPLTDKTEETPTEEEKAVNEEENTNENR